MCTCMRDIFFGGFWLSVTLISDVLKWKLFHNVLLLHFETLTLIRSFFQHIRGFLALMRNKNLRFTYFIYLLTIFGFLRFYFWVKSPRRTARQTGKRKQESVMRPMERPNELLCIYKTISKNLNKLTKLMSVLFARLLKDVFKANVNLR